MEHIHRLPCYFVRLCYLMPKKNLWKLTVLRIDSTLAQRLKVAAANERKSMKALAEEYISRGLVQAVHQKAVDCMRPASDSWSQS